MNTAPKVSKLIHSVDDESLCRHAIMKRPIPTMKRIEDNRTDEILSFLTMSGLVDEYMRELAKVELSMIIII